MRYLLLIHNDRSIWDNLSDSEREEWMAAHGKAEDEARRLGIYLGGEALQDASRARTVRRRHGSMTVTDGPFAETKEQLGGFYALDCTRAQAHQIAAMIPDGRTGSIEIRAVANIG